MLKTRSVLNWQAKEQCRIWEKRWAVLAAIQTTDFLIIAVIIDKGLIQHEKVLGF